MLPLPASRVSVGEDPACEVPISAGLGIAPVHFTLEPWEGGHFIQENDPQGFVEAILKVAKQ